jgi:hypothetical protein
MRSRERPPPTKEEHQARIEKWHRGVLHDLTRYQELNKEQSKSEQLQTGVREQGTNRSKR